ncbi:MAG TPA: glycosyltransferase [Deltaproteobacteria bacterium]|nr:glycosyltransferase [Deltaproteobacteria bacterium]
MKGRLAILETWVDPVTMGQAVAKVEEFVEWGERPHVIFAVNPEKNFSVPGNPALHEAFRSADLLIPDGIGVVLAARLLHRARLSRVPGVELMEEICRLSEARGYGIFLYGALEEVNARAAEVLRERYPSLRIAGRVNGYLPNEEMPRVVETINASGAQVLFLAMGSPRQEQWFAAYRDRLTTVRVVQGIGGTLDVLAGTVRRAPAAWCRYSAEWLYRLLSEPGRIGRQRVLPLFAAQVFVAKLRLLAHGRGAL